MTVDSPLITLGPKLAKRQMQTTSPNMFHDYAVMRQCVRDHTLLLDLPPQEGGTQSLMYEVEPSDSQIALLSPCASIADSTSSQFEAFDLKPQFEQSDDLLKFGVDLKELGQLEPELSETSNLLWSSLNCVDNLKMEDMFQMDKGDAIDQGPTLNELNAVDSVSLVGDDTMDHLLSSVDSALLGQVLNSTVQQTLAPVTVFSSPITSSQSQSMFTSCGAAPAVTASLVAPSVGGVLPTVSSSSLASKLPLLLGNPQTVSMTPAALATRTPVVTPGVFTGQNTSLAPAPSSSGLGMSVAVTCAMAAPTQASTSSWTAGMGAPLGSRGVKRTMSPSTESTGSVDRKWEEIKEFIHKDEAALAKKIKCEPDVAFTPTDDLESQDEDNVSEGENSDDEDGNKAEFSDNESVGSHSSFLEEFMTGRKDKRYFWQYNTQAKGPKGKRLCKTVKTDDPHILCTFEDPVFDPELNQNRYKHNGKARRGDGNDITPNAWKLYQIGSELKMLGRELNDIVPVSEMPVGVRSKTRKEKNKFASRACRLKKKAQHEAHKLKLFGLEQEHNQLMRVLASIRHELKTRIQQPETSDGEHLSVKLDRHIKKNLTVMIAGHTTEYVNSVLEKIATGDSSGGIPIPPRSSRTRSISE